MEVVGVVASSLQIVSHCGQITMTIIKWVESVKTVDDRIDTFVHEVNTLRATYDSLNRSLKEPSMLEAARNTNRDAGGHLWAHLSRTLQDCERTMNGIINVLRRIQDCGNFVRPVVKQLKESLNSGDLSRLREQVVMFNSSLQLPMQMIGLTMQLRQQEMTTNHQLQLNDQMSNLRRSIERISKGLPRRKPSLGGSTLMGSSTDKAWFDNMESYMDTAKQFLDNASVAASTLSARSVSQVDESDANYASNQYRRNSNFVPLTVERLHSISMYVDQVPTESTSGTALTSDVQSEHVSSQAFPDDSDEDDDDGEIELVLLQTLLHNGNNKLDIGDYAAAEENYREALTLSKSQAISSDSRTACSTADICLMLGGCIVKQQKYDEAISLLQPLANLKSTQIDMPQPCSASIASSGQRNPDRGQALSANHLLGEVYLKKSDFMNAEKYAVQAYKGRKKVLGPAHQNTIESVQLVVEMYKAKGQVALANAYTQFLEPIQPAPLPVAFVTTGTASPLTATSPFSEPAMPPINPASQPRRSTFNISMPFRSAKNVERSDAPSPIPPLRPTGSMSSPSSGYSTSIQRWGTADITDSYVPNPERQRSSLERAPTLYAAMSRSEMQDKFQTVADYSKIGKTSKAVDAGIAMLKRYDPEEAIFIHREAELEKNVKKSKFKGLAGSGYGYSALHFFCDLKFEPIMEVELLLELGADVNAVAYKAGYSKVEPFTALSLAVDRRHCNLVRLLLNVGSDPSNPTGSRYNPELDFVHPIIKACQQGQVGVMQVLLEYGMAIAEQKFPRGMHGNSLLHDACYRCDLGMVEYLMSFARRNGILDNNVQSFIGRPGQQDSFGLTPIMYAVDMRDCTDPKLRAHKLRNRIACLKFLLENNDIRVQETDNGEIVVDHPRGNSPGRLAVDLNVQDRRGNTVHWYANEARGGDAALVAFLDDQSRKSHLIEF